MRTLLLVAAILSFFLPSPVQATWTNDVFIGTPPAGFICGLGFTGVSTANCSISSHCAAVGTLITVELSYYQSSGAATATMGDTNGFTWHTRADTATAANNYRTYIFDTVSTNATCDSYTATMSTTVAFGILRVNHFISSLGSAAFDNTCSPTPACWVSSTSTNPQNGTAFTVAAGGLVVAIAVCAEGFNGFTVGTGYTEIDYSGSNAWAAEYKVSSGGSETPSFANATTCTIGTSVINLAAASYIEVAVAGHGYPMVIKYPYRSQPRPKWDNRRHRLEIVSI